MAEPDGSRHGSLEFRGKLKAAGVRSFCLRGGCKINGPAVPAGAIGAAPTPMSEAGARLNFGFATGLAAKIHACLNPSFSLFVNTLATNPT
jgi:hypothetical protein